MRGGFLFFGRLGAQIDVGNKLIVGSEQIVYHP